MSLTAISETLVPVIVSGYDTPDQSRLLLGGVNVSAGPGLFPWFALEALQDFWVEMIEVDTHSGGGEVFLGVQGPESDLPTPSVIVPSGIWSQVPNSIQTVRNVAGGTVLAPNSSSFTLAHITPPGPGGPEQLWSFQRPGLLVPSGFVFTVGGQQGESFHCNLAVRE